MNPCSCAPLTCPECVKVRWTMNTPKSLTNRQKCNVDKKRSAMQIQWRVVCVCCWLVRDVCRWTWRRWTDKRALLTDKRALLTDKRALLTDKRALLTDKRALLTDKRAVLTDKRAVLTYKERCKHTMKRCLCVLLTCPCRVQVNVTCWILSCRSGEASLKMRVRREPCVAVCCSVLQCVAGCCSVLLQCVAGCCRVLQCVAVCCSVLQCVAVWCSVMQWFAVICSVLQLQEWRSFARHQGKEREPCVFSVSQCVAVCCRWVVGVEKLRSKRG